MATRYRDIVGPVDPATGLPDTGEADLAGQLAAAGRRVAGVGLELGEQVMAARGEREGTEAGATGTPKTMSDFAATTPYGRAYKSAAEVTYVNRQQIDIAAKADELAIKHEGRPDEFQNAFYAFYGALKKEAPAEYHPRIEAIAKAHYTAGYNRLTAQRIAQGESDAKASVYASIPAEAALGVRLALQTPGKEGDAQLLGIAARVLEQAQVLGFDDLEIAKVKGLLAEAIDDELFKQKVQPAADKITAAFGASTSQGNDALAALVKSKTFDNEDLDSILNEVQKYNNNRGQVARALHADTYTDLSRRLDAGDTGRDLWGIAKKLYEDGAITLDGRASLEGRIRSNVEARAREQAENYFPRLDLIFDDNIAEARAPLFDADKKERDDYDRRFVVNIAKKGLFPGTKEYTDEVLRIVRRAGIVPDSVKLFMDTLATSNSAPDAAIAAELFKAIGDQEPVAVALTAVTPQARVVLETMASMQRVGGADPRAAHDKALKMIELGPQNRERLLSAVRSKSAVEDTDAYFREDLDARFDPIFFGHEGEGTEYFRERYREAYELGFVTSNGDHKIARSFAQAAFVRAGTSEVNGYVQSFHYVPVGDIETWRADIRLTVAAAQIGRDMVDPDKVELIEVPETLQSEGRTYGLAVRNKNGSYDLLRDPKGSPLKIRSVKTPEEWRAVERERWQYIKDQEIKKNEAALRLSDRLLHADVMIEGATQGTFQRTAPDKRTTLGEAK